MLRKNQRGRVHFEHDGRTDQLVAGSQAGPFINRRGGVLVIDEYLLLANRRPPRIAIPALYALRVDHRGPALYHCSQVDQLAFGIKRDRVELLVQEIEAAGERGQSTVLQLFYLERQGQNHALAMVAQVDLKTGSLL